MRFYYLMLSKVCLLLQITKQVIGDKKTIYV